MDESKYITQPNGNRVEMEYALRCCNAIEKIKRIIQDTSIEDKECFWRIEEIVLTFEELDIEAGSRHDF